MKIFLEGNIGSGKSTLIRILKDYFQRKIEIREGPDELRKWSGLVWGGVKWCPKCCEVMGSGLKWSKWSKVDHALDYIKPSSVRVGGRGDKTLQRGFYYMKCNVIRVLWYEMPYVFIIWIAQSLYYMHCPLFLLYGWPNVFIIWSAKWF